VIALFALMLSLSAGAPLNLCGSRDSVPRGPASALRASARLAEARCLRCAGSERRRPHALARPAPQPATDAVKALAEANALYEKNENDKALAAYDRVVALDARNPEGHLGRGRTLARMRKYEEAIAAFSEAIRLKPDDALALRDRGHYYINLHRVEPALADLTKAESLNKNDYGIYYHLALAKYVTGDFAGAATAYAGCLRTAPNDANRIACYGWQVPTLIRAGRKQEALKALDAALALAVKPDWYSSVASVRLKRASSASSSRWMAMLPAIVRTAPGPTPRSSTARRAASFRRGWLTRFR